MSPHLRWMIRRDFPEVLEIERLAFDPDDRWSGEEFLARLRSRSVMGLVAESTEWSAEAGGYPVLGYLVFGLLRDRVEVQRIAVHAGSWGRGVGRSLVDWLQGKYQAEHRRDRITLDVPEDFLGAHLFLRACGFRAEQVVRGGLGPDRDLYRFEHRLELGALAAPSPALPGLEDRQC